MPITRRSLCPSSPVSGHWCSHVQQGGVAWATGRTRPAGFLRRCKQYSFGTLQDAACHVTSDRREALQKFFQAIIVFQVLEQCPDRNPCALENWRAPKNVGINRDQVTHFHAATIAAFRPRVKSQPNLEKFGTPYRY